MQGAFLRVFVVALSLIAYPKEDIRVEQREDLVKEGMRWHEERLPTDEGEPEQERTYISEEVKPITVHDEQKDPTIPDQSFSVNKSSSVSQFNNFSLAENSTIERQGHLTEEYSIEHILPNDGDLYLAEADLSLPKGKGELETRSKTLKVENEDQPVLPDVKSSLKLETDPHCQICKKREGIQRSGYFWGPSMLLRKEERIDLEVLSSGQKVPPTNLLAETSEEDHLKTTTDWGSDYLSYMWNALFIFSTIRFLRKYLTRFSNQQHECNANTILVNSISSEVSLPDSGTLHRFHAQCIQLPPNKKWRVGEFLEGFANDLVQAMKTTSDRDVGMVIEDFQMVEGSCKIIVPFAAPEPYSFQCQLRSNMHPDMRGCGNVKMVRNVKSLNGCHCETSNKGDDMLCLLHGENDKVEAKITDVYDGQLCMKSTPFLSKSQVSKWFRSTVRQAWAQISHKYEFELKFHNLDTLVVRFRSGKKMNFNMSPVVKLDNTDAYFFISPGYMNSDISWTLSMTIYESEFLKHLSEGLPENSCHIKVLEIMHFLHKKQTVLTGDCFLEELHFKTTLMHLLLTKESSQWHPDFLACRLQDLMALMEESLRRRLLRHLLIGNKTIQTGVKLPATVVETAPVNLFYPLAADIRLYTNTVRHFEETLKNAHALIQEYASSK
ncbi:inositol 1,4,5-trisphosphate receptor-interacting protein [Lampris incognitus]|uniref:inositol 1,4,5-trisphosphate receptor-interacting protein n=1 Tax=Lampris incognitus TaxID=2546036 RepID=UPI0024B6264B|nr:inositol 1,4,5-trisphosphate receptor-interacting protein [Lampris incognitus]